MNPNSPLGERFAVVNNPGESLRLQDLHVALDELDERLANLPSLGRSPVIAVQLAEGQLRIGDEMMGVAGTGDVVDAHLTTPYDFQRHPTDPMLIVASRILAFSIKPRGIGRFARRRALQA